MEDLFPRPTHEALQGDIKRVAKFWGERAQNEKSLRCTWTDSPLIQQHYIHPTISGDNHSNWFMWVKDNYFVSPVGRALSLGCGDGCLERHGAVIDVFKECDAFDVSPEAVKVAIMKAKEMGIDGRINYQVADINEITLLDNYYDVVFCAMSMHHFENLEHILLEIENSLKDGGLLIFNEYVGPNRFQWTDKQLKIANELLKLLPEKYRLDPTTGRYKEAIKCPSRDYMIAVDPSEAVRSADIMALVEKRFDVIHKAAYGGTLVNLVLENIIVNFDEKNPEDMAYLQSIFYVEKLAVREKILDNNFSLIISKKRTGQTL